MPKVIDGISHIGSAELKEVLADRESEVVVIDVREPEEYEAAHIQGLPLIPMGDIIDIVDRLDRGKEYVFVCRSGRRSLEVSKFFQSSGFEKVHNYEGGMLRWQEEGNAIAAGPEHIIEQYRNQEQLERKKNS